MNAQMSSYETGRIMRRVSRWKTDWEVRQKDQIIYHLLARYRKHYAQGITQGKKGHRSIQGPKLDSLVIMMGQHRSFHLSTTPPNMAHHPYIMTSTTSTSSTLTPFDAFKAILDIQLEAYCDYITEGDEGDSSMMLAFGDADHYEGWLRLDIEDGDRVMIDWKMRKYSEQSEGQRDELIALFQKLNSAVIFAAHHSDCQFDVTYAENVVGQ